MLRSNQYCSRYEETPIHLDTSLTLPRDGEMQTYIGHKFTINDRSSYFDWFNGFFEVKFVVNTLDGTVAYNGDADKSATIINGSTSLITTLKILQNGKSVYKGNNLFLSTHVKSLIEYSSDYAGSIATSEHFYLDNNDKLNEENYGFLQRLNATKNYQEVSCIIPLNRYSFFKSLETNMLPPSQIVIEVTLTNDDILIYKTHDSENARVVLSKFNLWIPRMIFNSVGLSYVMKNYMIPTNWTYLHETVYMLNKINHSDNNFRISPSALNPKYVFVFFQRTDKKVVKMKTLIYLIHLN